MLSRTVISGSVCFAGSVRVVEVEHAFARTKARCRPLLTRNSAAGDSACAASASPVAHNTSESGEAALKGEEVYQTIKTLAFPCLAIPEGG